jgi:general secretion pathway protein G
MRQVFKNAVNRRGVSLVELIVTLSILSILAMVILPTAQLMSKRSKEVELRRNLRIIRNAIDDFKKTNDKLIEENKKIKGLGKDDTISGYPETLDILVEGADHGGLLKEKKKYLRRIPEDPFADKSSGNPPEWGLRSYTDDSDSSTTDGKDVYDVFSKSDGTAIDGSKYKDW